MKTKVQCDISFPSADIGFKIFILRLTINLEL